MIPEWWSTAWLLISVTVFVLAWWRLKANPVPYGPILPPEGMPEAPEGYAWLLYRKERRLVLHTHREGAADYDIDLVFTSRKHVISAGRILLSAYKKGEEF